jgi:23S rRNA (uracil1939-C5)-methyltransferase
MVHDSGRDKRMRRLHEQHALTPAEHDDRLPPNAANRAVGAEEAAVHELSCSLDAVAAPVVKDQELVLRVDSLAYGGNGVARLDGFVVFVRRGLPGDRVRARVTKVKRSHAEALAVEVLEPGAKRVEAPCAHYPACGGCRFQDLAYEAQVAAKEAQVAEALRRIGGLSELPLEPIVPAESPFHYRNKLEYSFAATPSGPALGFHKAGRWDEVLDIERCWLTTDLGNALRQAVVDWARTQKLEAYDQAEQRGYLRHLVVREGRNTGQALVVLVTAPGDLAGREELIATLRRFPEVRSLHWGVNPGAAEVTSVATTLLYGDDAIEEELLGLRFRVRPNAFLQTNTTMAERLYELAIEDAGLTGEETVYDLYCGIGTIGLCMAGRALTVWGVDVSEESIACALENAELNGIANAAFFAGEVGLALEELRARAGDPDVVVVDPPRAGLSGKALRRLARLGAETIVYVSCNPTTLAGNVKELVGEWGYGLERARPVDMFPHTPHVETVALLTRS